MLIIQQQRIRALPSSVEGEKALRCTLPGSFARSGKRSSQPQGMSHVAAILTSDLLDSPSGTQVLNVSETLMLNVQKNLFALKDFLTRNPHLFHSSPSEPTSSRTLVTEQEAWKVCFYFASSYSGTLPFFSLPRRSRILFLNFRPC
jgi:hypothetical protein